MVDCSYNWAQGITALFVLGSVSAKTPFRECLLKSDRGKSDHGLPRTQIVLESPQKSATLSRTFCCPRKSANNLAADSHGLSRTVLVRDRKEILANYSILYCIVDISIVGDKKFIIYIIQSSFPFWKSFSFLILKTKCLIYLLAPWIGVSKFISKHYFYLLNGSINVSIYE